MSKINNFYEFLNEKIENHKTLIMLENEYYWCIDDEIKKGDYYIHGYTINRCNDAEHVNQLRKNENILKIISSTERLEGVDKLIHNK